MTKAPAFAAGGFCFDNSQCSSALSTLTRLLLATLAALILLSTLTRLLLAAALLATLAALLVLLAALVILIH
jgi:hypothetical protein